MEKLGLAVMFLFSSSQVCQACGDGPCQIPTKHYSEIGCKPIYEEGRSCPIRYDCSSFGVRDNQKCYFNGNVYDPETSLSKLDEKISPCSGGCICVRQNNFSSFICSSISCPDIVVREEDCILQYSPFKCCPTGKVCGDQASLLNECYLEGERYLEDELMYPRQEPCYKCSCQKGYDNSTIVGNPNCYEVNCGIELFYMDQLMNGCIPVYFGTRGCCPVSWRCPNDKDIVIQETDDIKEIDPMLQCKFGNLTLNVGELVSSDQTCVSCKCLLPPMVHCVQDKYQC